MNQNQKVRLKRILKPLIMEVLLKESSIVPGKWISESDLLNNLPDNVRSKVQELDFETLGEGGIETSVQEILDKFKTNLRIKSVKEKWHRSGDYADYYFKF